MHHLHSQNNEIDEISYKHNTRNKATVKKELSNRLLRFNELDEKENHYQQSNLMYLY